MNLFAFLIDIDMKIIFISFFSIVNHKIFTKLCEITQTTTKNYKKTPLFKSFIIIFEPANHLTTLLNKFPHPLGNN